MPDDLSWDAATLPGSSGPNQDRVLVEQTPAAALFAVIDGATSSHNERPDGGDYADALAAGLQLGIRAGVTDPRALLVHGIQHAVTALALPTPSQPSAAVALAIVDQERAAFAVLGDCTAAIDSDPDGVRVLTDDRLAQVARDDREELRACRGGDEVRGALRARVVEVERAARNQPAGYYVAADSPDAGRHALTVAVPRAALRGFVLATDGAAAGPQRYATPGPWAHVLHVSPRDILAAVELAEQADPERRRWPRSKPSDDKALIAARVGGA